MKAVPNHYLSEVRRDEAELEKKMEGKRKGEDLIQIEELLLVLKRV